MKTHTISTKSRTIALVALSTTALMLVMASPAWAETPSIERIAEIGRVDLTLEVPQVEGIIGFAELLEPAAEDEPIVDGGDWEMGVVDEDAVPDAGGDEPAVTPDEPNEDGGDEGDVPQTQEDTPDEPGDQADEPDEPTDEVDEPDEPTDEVDEPDEPEQPTDEVDEPQGSTEPTPTSKPNTPASEPNLPFTGGNATPYAIGGLLMALAGVAVLITKRRVFARS